MITQLQLTASHCRITHLAIVSHHQFHINCQMSTTEESSKHRKNLSPAAFLEKITEDLSNPTSLITKMVCGVLLSSIPVHSNSIPRPVSRKAPKHQANRCSTRRIQCSDSGQDAAISTEKFQHEASVTGGAYDFERATTSLTQKLLLSTKKVTLVRHGLSTWNEESRVQGSSNLSVLTETGVKQAERCREALTNIYFDKCFSSPISRAKSTAEVMWQGKEQELVFLDSLKEAHLFFLEGMKNGLSPFLYLL